jgi:hypothetical protein
MAATRETAHFDMRENRCLSPPKTRSSAGFTMRVPQKLAFSKQAEFGKIHAAIARVASAGMQLDGVGSAG